MPGLRADAEGLKKDYRIREIIQNKMRIVWWCVAILTEVVIICFCYLNGDITQQSTDTILSNFIIIATAILVVIWAVFPIQKEMLKRTDDKIQPDMFKQLGSFEKILNEYDVLFKMFRSIDVAGSCATLTLLLSIIALFLNGVKNPSSVLIGFLIYGALFCIMLSIAEMSELELHLLRTIRQ
jgi:hypothetical protein